MHKKTPCSRGMPGVRSRGCLGWGRKRLRLSGAQRSAAERSGAQRSAAERSGAQRSAAYLARAHCRSRAQDMRVPGTQSGSSRRGPRWRCDVVSGSASLRVMEKGLVLCFLSSRGVSLLRFLFFASVSRFFGGKNGKCVFPAWKRIAADSRQDSKELPCTFHYTKKCENLHQQREKIAGSRS